MLHEKEHAEDCQIRYLVRMALVTLLGEKELARQPASSICMGHDSCSQSCRIVLEEYCDKLRQTSVRTGRPLNAYSDETGRAGELEGENHTRALGAAGEMIPSTAETSLECQPLSSRDMYNSIMLCTERISMCTLSR